MDKQLRNSAQAPETVGASLTPQTILNSIQIVVPAGLITVEGIVMRMNEYPKDDPKLVYGLSGTHDVPFAVGAFQQLLRLEEAT